METVKDLLAQAAVLVSEHPYLTGAGACITALALWLSTRRSGAKPGPRDTLVVHGTATSPEIPSLSPFVCKLEIYLKLAKVPYVLSTDIAASSKGKVPWVSYNDVAVADTQFCIKFVQEQFGVDLNHGLSTEQKAVARAFRIMMDEFHFWCQTYFRFYELSDPVLKRFLPAYLLRLFVKNRVDSSLHAQGVGRHSKEEILGFFTDNLQTIQDFLGEKPYMMGDAPTDVDCSVFSLLAGFYFYQPAELKRVLGADCLQKQFPKLYAYTLRMKALTYPDYKV